MKWKVIRQPPDAETLVRWNEFLPRAEFSTHYTTPNFLIDPFVRGGERFAVLAFDDENIAAVLTGVHARQTIHSGFAVRPQTAFRRDANKLAAAKALISGMLEKGGADLRFLEFYAWEKIEQIDETGFQTERSEGDNKIVMLDLSKGAEAIFKGFSQTRRSEIRKAIKQNALEIKEIDSRAELAELYEIHRDWCARKNNEPDSFEDFEFAHSQKDYRKTLIAKHEGKVVAGSYYRFCSGGVVEYAANNSRLEYQKFRPNDLIGWRSIEWACAAGFKHYSMGGSHLFLRRFGGDIVSSYRYKYDRSRLKIYNLKENIKNLSVNVYRGLSAPFKSRIKSTIKQSAGKD